MKSSENTFFLKSSFFGWITLNCSEMPIICSKMAYIWLKKANNWLKMSEIAVFWVKMPQNKEMGGSSGQKCSASDTKCDTFRKFFTRFGPFLRKIDDMWRKSTISLLKSTICDMNSSHVLSQNQDFAWPWFDLFDDPNLKNLYPKDNSCDMPVRYAHLAQ